jgi:subtilisin family serine protease
MSDSISAAASTPQRTRKLRPYPGAFALILFLSCWTLPPADRADAASTPGVIPGQYLVLLDAAVPDDMPQARKAKTFRHYKDLLLSEMQMAESRVLQRYSHLPMMAMDLPDKADRDRLRKNPLVRAIYPNRILYTQLTESLPLIRQSLPAELGYGGFGTTIAILDTGLDYTRPEFGNCTAPGAPADCRVIEAVDIAEDDGNRDENGHGTHVGAIAAAVAPEAGLVALDVFDGETSSDALLLSAINWAIAHQVDFNIVALNLSLGDGARHTSPCGDPLTNPYVVPVANAREAGIVMVAAAGNQGYADGLNSPACTPDVVSVGAVYDDAVGGISYDSCTDDVTDADQIACFSNSADFLSIWAPGALITAVGTIRAGTSQAAPHVVGTAAVLRAAFPEENVAETVDRLTTSDATITDPRNGSALPRLDEQQALGVASESASGPPAVSAAPRGSGDQILFDHVPFGLLILQPGKHQLPDFHFNLALELQ